MPKLLSENDVAAYRDRGYHFPVDALSAGEVTDFRRRLEDYEAASGGPIKGEMRHRSHVLFTWINDMIRHPKILDAIEDLLGPNILCWNTSFFIKEAHDPGFVSWHQDATYWGLNSSDVATAWIAMSPANKVSGCMKFIAGTHKQQVQHEDTFDQNNLLTRGQEIAVEVDEGGRRWCVARIPTATFNPNTSRSATSSRRPWPFTRKCRRNRSACFIAAPARPPIARDASAPRLSVGASEGR